MAVAKDREAACHFSLPFMTRPTRAALPVLAVLIVTLVLRLPTFFEPPWHTDEGIFAAVAQGVVSGGRLYADVWESKPPLFLYLYVAITELFGAGVLPLRIATALAAIGTELALFAVARRFLSPGRSLFAALALACLLGVPFWDGNLALTESFAVLPSTLGVLAVLAQEDRGCRRRSAWLFAAGVLFGVAFLLRQTAAVVAAATVLWLLLTGREWLRPLLLIAAGSLLAIVPVVASFLALGTFAWFWDANVLFFLKYVPSGQEVPFEQRPLVLLPLFVAALAVFVARRRGEDAAWGLPALWLCLTLAAALLTGRPYSHYLLQAFPPLALLLAFLVPALPRWRPSMRQWPGLSLAAALVVLWLGVVTPAFDGDLLARHFTKREGYYANFFTWALGLKSDADYYDYFDQRVSLTLKLEETLKRLGADGRSLFIWGEVPWVYALARTEPASRYTTSFYVLLLPRLDAELRPTLEAHDPQFIVVDDAWPDYYDQHGVLNQRYLKATRDLNALLAAHYEYVAAVGRARVFKRTLERPPTDERTRGLARLPEADAAPDDEMGLETAMNAPIGP